MAQRIVGRVEFVVSLRDFEPMVFPRVSTSSCEKIRQVSISSLTNRRDGVFVGLRSIATARAGLVELLFEDLPNKPTAEIAVTHISPTSKIILEFRNSQICENITFVRQGKG